MRHAKSSWKDASLPDEERPLNQRGKAAADQMGQFIRTRGLTPDVILSSTAKRARQTAKRVKKAAGFNLTTTKVSTLYFHGAEAYLREIAKLSSDIKTALVVGHNPDIEIFIARIAGKHVDVPTATLAHITIDGEWDDIQNTSVLKIAGVYRPKELNAAANPQTDPRRPRRPRPSS